MTRLATKGGRRRPVVAIDGPAGAGKTTVTHLVAEKLGYQVVDTGALYRTVALAASRRGIDFDDAAAVAAMAGELAARGAVKLERDPGRVTLDGEDVSAALRTPEMSQGASKVSALPEVRAALLELQRSQGGDGGVVLEGRDIGTVVFPDAEAKFFLTADIRVRAERRCRELEQRGSPQPLADVEREVVERDRRDSQRSVAPLARAVDAELIDSSCLDVGEVVERIVERVRATERQLRDAGMGA
jgi:cytidylate kinase